MSAYENIANFRLLNYDSDRHLEKLFLNNMVTANNFFYLFKIGEHPGISQAEITEIIGLHQSTVTRAINTLEKQGLIKRLKSTKDKRLFYLDLTEAGSREFELAKNKLKDLNQLLTLDPNYFDMEKLISVIKDKTNEL